jgi:DNA polymerase delta subunit 2
MAEADNAGLEAPPPAAAAAALPDVLLAAPAAGAPPPPPAPRAAAAYANEDARFRLPDRDYGRQYAQLYFYRLQRMRPAAEAAARAAWPAARLGRVLDLPEEGGDVAVVGTLYKEMAGKPSILDEYAADRGALDAALAGARFARPDDRVVLEDEGARVALAGPGLPPGSVVAGVVAAVRGRVLPSGELEVLEVQYAGVPPQPPRPPLPGPPDAAPYALLVSGLGLGDALAAPGGAGSAAAAAVACAAGGAGPLALQLLIDFVSGALGGAAEQALAARVARVVVAGGLLRGGAPMSQPTAYGALRAKAAAGAPLREADLALTELAAAAPLDVMPGAGDPANFALPQQPLHRCLLPGAAAFPHVVRATNPHAFSLAGVKFLGTSGMNVDDVARYSALDDRCAILARLLEWRHLVPTAPDTLASHPYHDADPFILDEAPHVLFAGGQPAFGSGLARGGGGQAVRLVAVPDFAATGVAVLVNLATLEVRPLAFGAVLGGA